MQTIDLASSINFSYNVQMNKFKPLCISLLAAIFFQGCAVIAVADAALTVGATAVSLTATTVSAGASVVGAGVELAASAIEKEEKK